MVDSWGKMGSLNLENRLTRREFLASSIGAIVAIAAGCGERMIPEPGPYELLARRWIRDDVIQVDDQDVSRTISFIFHEIQIYAYSEIGKRSNNVEVLNYAEQGTYEVTVPETSNFEGTMSLTPIGTDKEPYTVDWYIRKPGDGNLILTYSDGKVLDLEVYRKSNN